MDMTDLAIQDRLRQAIRSGEYLQISPVLKDWLGGILTDSEMLEEDLRTESTRKPDTVNNAGRR